MKPELLRTYYPEGTNGKLYLDGVFQCYTIELPWLDNQPQVSCIPEGRYELTRRCSTKFGRHLHIGGVPGRSLILVHKANDALKELKGCIAPVSFLTGRGKGIQSRAAFEPLIRKIYAALEEQPVFITIKTERL